MFAFFSQTKNKALIPSFSCHFLDFPQSLFEMGKLKSPNRSSNQNKVFNKVVGGLVNQIETQQHQMLSLANDLKLQYQHRVNQVNLFKQRISQLTRESRLLKMERTADAAKSDLLVGLKQRDAFQYKLKLDQIEGEIAYLKEGFEIVCHKCSNAEHTPKSVIKNGEECNILKELQCEVQRLKHENKKLSSKNSALSSEREFAWKQFKIIESNLTDQLKKKYSEIELANDKIRKLLGDMEKLQSSDNKKHEEVMALRVGIAKLEEESAKKSEEISRLCKETELLRKSKCDNNTPVYCRCTVEQRMSLLGGNNSVSVTVKKDPHSSRVLEKGSRSSKRRKTYENNTCSPSTSEDPKLFTKKFMVPKLKMSSS